MRHSLVPAYQRLHSRGHFAGYSIERYLPKIAELVRDSKARTLLDYGCGRGHQYFHKNWHEAWGGIMPTLYDPAVLEFSALPLGKFDGVICTDVLEHVPESELHSVIGDLVYHARLWCFAAVCCRPAKWFKKLPDGRNVHVTIRPQEWWQEMLGEAFNGHAALHLEFTP